MAQVCIADDPLTASAALVYAGDLPRPLQQILFDAAAGAVPPEAARHLRRPNRSSRMPPKS